MLPGAGTNLFKTDPRHKLEPILLSRCNSLRFHRNDAAPFMSKSGMELVESAYIALTALNSLTLSNLVLLDTC